MIGSLAIVLHAHLPWVRHPEHARSLEEHWFFEAVAECYLPLLRNLRDWSRDGVDWGLTLGVTPTLGSMWDDPGLRARVARYLAERRDLARREMARTALIPALHAAAGCHASFYERAWEDWEACGGDLSGAFARWARTGRLEILAGPATHPVLPLLADEPGSLRAQLGLGVREHERRFGQPVRGLWLPECAWCSRVEPALVAAGFRHCLLETHGVLGGDPPPPAAVFLPVRSPGGITVVGRDPASARQVWSRQGGYPGDPRYREFHRDLADDADWDWIAELMVAPGVRHPTGFKYHRVTGGTKDKEWYDRAEALEAVRGHAGHFLEGLSLRLARAAVGLGCPPMVVAPYDAELFGHWWFEGPEFLDQVMRRASRSGVATETLSQALDRRALPWPMSRPAESSWGDGGHLGVWLHPTNADLQPRLRTAGRRMAQVAARAFGDRGGLPGGGQTQGEAARWASQAARELLLAQASDWPFLIRMGTAASYARQRVESHLEAFHRLADRVLLQREAPFAHAPASALPGDGFPEPDPAAWL